MFGSLGYGLHELEFVASFPAYLPTFTPQNSPVLYAKRPAPWRNLGFLPKKWTKTLFNFVPGLFPFLSEVLRISCSFDANVHPTMDTEDFLFVCQVCHYSQNGFTQLAPGAIRQHDWTLVLAAVLKKTLFSRWWQLKDFLFSPLFGEMIQFDSYFSKGLKPPTSSMTLCTVLLIFPVISARFARETRATNWVSFKASGY